MNRAQRRLAQKVERQTGGVFVREQDLESLVAAQRFFLAVVKAQGRVRIPADALEALVEGDRVTMKREDGAIILSFVAAGSEGDPA